MNQQYNLLSESSKKKKLTGDEKTALLLHGDLSDTHVDKNSTDVLERKGKCK